MALTQREIKNLKGQLNDILGQLEESGAEDILKIKEAASEYLSSAVDKAEEMKDAAKEKAVYLKGQADDYAKQHPWQLSVYSLAIGLLIGLFLSKTKSSK